MQYDKNIMNSFELVAVNEQRPVFDAYSCYPDCECEACGCELEEYWDEESNGDGGYITIAEQLEEMGIEKHPNLEFSCYVCEEGWHCPECLDDSATGYFVNVSLIYGEPKYVEGTRYETPFEQYKRKLNEYHERQRAAGQLSMFD